MIKRPQIKKDAEDEILYRVQRWLEMRLRQKGRRQLASRHELLGILDEEMAELREAVHSGTRAAIDSECLDVAVAAIMGLLSPDWGW